MLLSSIKKSAVILSMLISLSSHLLFASSYYAPTEHHYQYAPQRNSNMPAPAYRAYQPAPQHRRSQNTAFNFWKDNKHWVMGDGEEGVDRQWFMDTPKRWMDQQPKESVAQVFDDSLDAPGRLGEMPGGWNAPSILVPNPVDVTEELGRGTKELMQSDIISINP